MFKYEVYLFNLVWHVKLFKYMITCLKRQNIGFQNSIMKWEEKFLYYT